MPTKIGTVALIRKPNGVSSFAALSPLKKALETRKIGHTGTLDPFADGLLVVLCGYATRLAPFFADLDKRYRATFRFGVSTDTLDPEGVTIETGNIPSRNDIESATGNFTGTIDQIPPKFSAIKVGGRRAYAEARKGKEVTLASRPVTIHSLELHTYEPPEAIVEIHCSKGTYIRSLARDIGHACDSAAYVGTLSRTAVGPFNLDEIDEAEPWTLLSPVQALQRLKSIRISAVDDDVAVRIRHGKKIEYTNLDPEPDRDGRYAVVKTDGTLAAVVEASCGAIRYEMVVPH